jgi:hypothetical protein
MFVCPSVCVLVCVEQPLAPTGQIFMKFYISVFFKICQENWKFKIQQEYQVPYMKTCVHLWQYLAEFFLEWGMFKTNVIEEIKTHILFSVTSPPLPKIMPFMR